MEIYSYAALLDPRRYIRLIHLTQPSHPEEPLHCEISTVCLDDTKIRYDGLSYTWSANVKTHTLAIGESILGITENLHQALKQLRSSQHRPIWVDAVCINQSDDIERSAQVSQMQQIFMKAEHVVAWVGEVGDEKCALVFEFLSTVEWDRVQEEADTASYDYVDSRLNFGDTELSNMGTRIMALRRADQLVSNHLRIGTELQYFNKRSTAEWLLTLDDLDCFLARPWFSRRWVIQEVYVAKDATLRCGPHSLSWKTLMKAISNTDYHCHGAKNNVAELLHAERDWTLDSDLVLGRGDILAAMERFENMACKDTRDIIGAIIGLWPDFGYSVDYGASEIENFCAFAQALVRDGRVYDVLRFAATCRKRPGLDDPYLASWVPDLRRLGHKLPTVSKVDGSWWPENKVLSPRRYEKSRERADDGWPGSAMVIEDGKLNIYHVRISRTTYREFKQQRAEWESWHADDGPEPAVTSQLFRLSDEDCGVLVPMAGSEGVFKLRQIIDRRYENRNLEWWNDIGDDKVNITLV